MTHTSYLTQQNNVRKSQRVQTAPVKKSCLCQTRWLSQILILNQLFICAYLQLQLTAVSSLKAQAEVLTARLLSQLTKAAQTAA